MVTRRRFLKLTAASGAVLLAACADPGVLGPGEREWLARQATPQTPLDPLSQPQFVLPLPQPQRVDATAGGRLNAAMRATSQWLGLTDATGAPLMTSVWGYRFQAHPTFPGATIVAHRDRPLEVMWQNQLFEREAPWVGHLLPVDTSIHLATPERLPKRGVPLVTHLHGGHTESASDGIPEAWFTKNWKETGATFSQRVYRYDNDQEAGTLWYHDHALGITRLNVYAGLAGFYLLRDERELELIDAGLLPSGPYEREVVIQDRMFAEDGELLLPTDVDEVEASFTFPDGETLHFERPVPDPSVVAEFFGDHILVNGVLWPKLEVEPRRYRIRLLNGSDSRFYLLRFDDGTPFWQIGADNGFLPTPVGLTELLIAPGQRADLVLDFRGREGGSLLLRNDGPDAPYKGPGGPVEQFDHHDATTGRIMRFDVTLPRSSAPDGFDPGLTLRDAPFSVNASPATVRQLVLFEGLDEYGRLQPLLGTLADGSLAWFDDVTETPGLGDVEEWRIYNATEDAHPIHLHLVSFELLGRQGFTGEVVARPQRSVHGGTGVGGRLTGATLLGMPEGPALNEAGAPLDTAIMNPGEVTRIAARFDRPGRYVWHCHILSHEDHEMMRPFHVGLEP